MAKLKCVNGHDRCEGGPFEGCPYCETVSTPLKYASKACNQFVRDMERTGLKPYHYRGRFFWQGPAVNIEGKNRDEVARATKVKLQQDDMGLGLVVYPVERGGPPCELL